MEFSLNLFISLTFLLAPALAFCVHKLHLYHEEDALRESVAWCVTQDNRIRCNLSLINYLGSKQSRLKLPQEYKLNVYDDGTDKTFINTIIQLYQTDLIQKYFSGELVYPKTKYEITGEPYFWYSLLVFLIRMEDHPYKLGKMDLWYYDENNSKILTEYGVQFYKLLYIALLANKEYVIITPAEWAIKNTKHYLDTGELI